MSGGRDGDCEYCPNCRNWRGASSYGYKDREVVDENSGRTLKVTYKKMKCTVCGHRWLERRGW